MKKVSCFLAGLFFLLLSLTSNAQEKKGAAYFTGKWEVLITGTPNGDGKLFFVINQKEGKLTGTVEDSTGAEVSKIDNADLNGDEITLYFNMNDYDISLVLKKKNEDRATGSLLNMFDAVADRVKKPK